MSQDCTIGDINIELSASRINSYGFYDSCIANKSQGYFVLSKFTKLDAYDPSEHKGVSLDDFYYPKAFNLLGVCARKNSCSEASIGRLYEDWFSQLDLEFTTQGPLNVKAFPPQNHNRPQFLDFKSFGTYFWIFFFAILLFSLASTFINRRLRRKDNDSEEDSSEESNPVIEKEQGKFWSHFDFIQNFQKISSPSKFKDPMSQTFVIARAIASVLVLIYHEGDEKKMMSLKYLEDFSSWRNFENKNPYFVFFFLGVGSVPMFFFIGGYVSIISIESFYKIPGAKAGAVF